MTNKKKMLLLIMLFEGFVYGGLMYLFHIDFAKHYIVLYYIFQFIFSRYREDNHLIWEEMKMIIQANGMLFLVQVLFNDVLQQNIFDLATLTALIIVFDIILNRTMRVIFRKYVADRVLVIGIGKHANDFVKITRENRFAMMNVLACVDINHVEGFENYRQACRIEDVEVVDYKQLDEVIEKYRINSVMLAIPDSSKSQMQRIIMDLFDKVPVVKYMPRVNGMMTFDSTIADFDGKLVVTSSQTKTHVIGKIIKRIIDILGGILGVLSLIPLSVIIKVISLKNGDHASIFFTQDRIGKDGKKIRIYKYRSMIPNAEAELERLMKENEDIRIEYLTNKKLVNDPRITKIGHFIRRTSIDEFPQFINVLMGNMSLVGPRPYLFREKEDMSIYYKSVIKCKPGITGMWQAHGRSDLSFKERLVLDDYYYRNWNVWLDLTIVYKTVKSVIFKKGAM